MRRHLRKQHPAVALLSVALLAGCGTTVDENVSATSGAPVSGDGLSAPQQPGGVAAQPGAASGNGAVAAPPAGTSGSISSGGSSTDAGAGGGPAGSGSSGGTPAGTPGGATLPSSGRGYDATHVFIGFPTNTDVSKAAPAGVGASAFGDQEGQIKAIVADVNAHGGLLGRTVVPRFHDIKTANLQTNPENEAQATCTAFTEDSTVVAVVNIVAGIDLPTFYACLAKHDTPIISAGFVPVDDPTFSTYAPYLYKTTAASFTALSPIWISRLTALGYFHGWNATTGRESSGAAKVGLLYAARQPQQRIFAALKQRLAAQHIAVTKEFQYDATSLDRESADMSNAVLQFRNAGVTHVLSSESDVLLFMTAADSQHYRPRYGLNSYHAAAVQLQGTVPSSQLVGSMGVGWLPTTDVDRAHNPGPVGPGERRCRQVMAKAHQDISSAAPAVVALALCDGVHMIVAGATSVHDLRSQPLRAGISRIGASFASALTWHSALDRRYALPGAVRDFRFDNGAFHYLPTGMHEL